MITHLRIRNFQAHEAFDVALEPVTVFAGPSGRGKTAVLRSLRWLFFNRPSGTAFIRRGAKGCSVSATVDGRKVSRRRGKGNAYVLDGQRLEAFGVGVPDPVAALLNVSDLNYQSQHSAPFWLSLSPGEVSRELNAIVNLGLIDRTLANLAAELRKARAAVSVSGERLAKAMADRDRLAWAKEANQEYAKISIQKIIAQETALKASRIASAVADGKRHGNTLKTLSRAKNEAITALRASETALEAGNRLEKLREAVKRYNSVATNVKEAGRQAAREKARLEADLRGVLCPVCEREMP